VSVSTPFSGLNGKQGIPAEPIWRFEVEQFEISEATLERDRTLKQRIHACAGISTYWIVNLIERQLEVYTNPINRSEEPTHKQRQDYGLTDQAGIIIGGTEGEPLAVQELFP